jgi:hypothetical protein
VLLVANLGHGRILTITATARPIRYVADQPSGTHQTNSDLTGVAIIKYMTRIMRLGDVKWGQDMMTKLPKKTKNGSKIAAMKLLMNDKPNAIGHEKAVVMMILLPNPRTEVNDAPKLS